LHLRTRPISRRVKSTSTTNINYLLLGLVAEKAEGKPLAQVMHDRLFRPLKMRETELPASTVNTIPEP
jgi:CubicO group peptidase (beta-lactamase class C family)